MNSWFINPSKYRYISHNPQLLELLTNLANELGQKSPGFLVGKPTDGNNVGKNDIGRYIYHIS